jgi:glucose-1-phosphate thymidylyltransferase
MPVYKQPMIYYPLKTLIDMGIKEILIIVASYVQQNLFYEYLGDGSKFGVKLQYIVQEQPNGLAEAFILGEKFIGNKDVTLILGDNVFLTKNKIDIQPNSIFTYKVKDPSAYGVVTVDEDGYIQKLIEKPIDFISDDAVVGLYVFTNRAVELAKTITPSPRGELEIVDLIRKMDIDEGVNVQEFDGVWFDCGTHDDLLECAEFVRALDKRTKRDIFL